MATFTGLTHEAYARRLGTLAGTIDVVYTNEPNLMTSWFLLGERPGGVVFVPWHEDLPRRFQAEHGYDLIPVLPALFGGDDAVARKLAEFEAGGTLTADLFDPLAGTVTPVQAPGILSIEPCSSLLIVER